MGEFSPFMAKLDRLGKEIGGEGQRRMLETLGRLAKDDVSAAVAGSLGDHSMSHWWRGRPVQIGGKYTVRADTVEITPGPGAAQMRVLEDGRQGGGSHDLVLVGRVRKNGTRRGRSRGRASGATRGKGTWTHAVERISRQTPQRAQVEFVKSLKKVL